MNKYLIFTGLAYYPDGGISDLKGSYETLSKCEEMINKYRKENPSYSGDFWYQIVRYEDMSLIEWGA